MARPRSNPYPLESISIDVHTLADMREFAAERGVTLTEALRVLVRSGLADERHPIHDGETAIIAGGKRGAPYVLLAGLSHADVLALKLCPISAVLERKGI